MRTNFLVVIILFLAPTKSSLTQASIQDSLRATFQLGPSGFEGFEEDVSNVQLLVEKIHCWKEDQKDLHIVFALLCRKDSVLFLYENHSSYFANGNLKEQYSQINGCRISRYVKLFANGRIHSIGSFIPLNQIDSGMLSGRKTLIGEDTWLFQHDYDAIPTGEWHFFNRNGRLIKKEVH